MNLEKLKGTINNLGSFGTEEYNPNYASLYSVEYVLKSKYTSFINLCNQISEELSKINKNEQFRCTFDNDEFINTSGAGISFISKSKEILPELDDDKENHFLYSGSSGIGSLFLDGYSNKSDKKIMEFYENSQLVKELHQKIRNWKKFLKKYKIFTINDTNLEFEISLYVDLKNITVKINGTNIIGDIPSFTYTKNLLTDKREINYFSDEVKQIINEDTIFKMYNRLKVNITGFSQEMQEEIQSVERSGIAKASIVVEKEKQKLLIMQQERLFKAYNLFKELTELLTNIQTEIKFDKIKLGNIENIIFKNNGLPNQEGKIEFEDFYKTNMVLRMLDLSLVDFANVDVRGIDFSNTNAHIHPQTVWNKDLTNTNLTNIPFSPFTDSFDNVILDGTIINCNEAQIDLEKVKSYNDNTIITKEVINVFHR